MPHGDLGDTRWAEILWDCPCGQSLLTLTGGLACQGSSSKPVRAGKSPRSQSFREWKCVRGNSLQVASGPTETVALEPRYRDIRSDSDSISQGPLRLTKRDSGASSRALPLVVTRVANGNVLGYYNGIRGFHETIVTDRDSKLPGPNS